MPRTFVQTEPKIVNKIVGESTSSEILQIATQNKDKLSEFERLIPTKKIEGVALKGLEEIQSLDPLNVAEAKAKKAFELNGYNPILVEDTSLDILGLKNLPGTFATFFVGDPEIRRKICEQWLKTPNRRAIARVILAIFDGNEVFTYEGKTAGTISKSPAGTNGFGFDDIFIPNNQPHKQTKTFAQMTPTEKDKYSMRTKAAKKFLLKEKDLKLGKYVFELPEPFESELLRLRGEKINKRSALKFAYTLEAVKGNKANRKFEAPNYEPIHQISTIYYDRYVLDKKSNSIGIVITDIDKANTKLKKNGDPIFWQMGPERRKLALAQRAEYFLQNTDPALIKQLQKMEKELDWPKKINRRHATLENLLKIDYKDTPFYARASKELGYKKLSSKKQVSRREISKMGLHNKIGKYPRLMFGMGSMPAVSGWRDAILTAAMGHMPVFINRNNIYAAKTGDRIELVKQVKKALNTQDVGKIEKKMFERNIGVALGTADPKKELIRAKRFYKDAGVKLFRIYTINSDPRFVETAVLLRNEFGNDVEIFAGQLVDKMQGLELVEKAGVDGIIFGHGGGRQCTSATNGMALSTVEEIYSVLTDSRFNATSILVEGGIGKSVGALVVLGIDGILYNQQFTRGTIETGGFFIQNKYSEFGQPYHGSASAPTMIIEAADGVLTDKMLYYSGRTKVPEGKKGFTKYAEKANSMAFWIDDFKHQAARTLADLGVADLHELRKFVDGYDKELLRIVSTEAASTSKAWGNN